MYTLTAIIPGRPTKTIECVNRTAADLWTAWYTGRGIKTTVTAGAAKIAEIAARLWTLGVRALRALVAGRFNYKPLRKADLVNRLAALEVAAGSPMV